MIQVIIQRNVIIMSRNKRGRLRLYFKHLFALRPSTAAGNGYSELDTSDLCGILEIDCAKIQEKFKDDAVLMSKQICSGGRDPIHGKVFFFDGMCNDVQVASDYVRPILLYDGPKVSVEYIASSIVFGSDLKLSNKIDDILSAILTGNSVYIFDGETKAIIADTKKLSTRSVSEPEN